MFKKKEENLPKPYNRDETEIISQLMNVDASKKAKQNEFNSMIESTVREERIIKHQVNRIASKTILKQRLVHLYVAGFYSQREMAHILCISPNTVSRLLRDKEIVEMIKAYQMEENEVVNSALKSLRSKAVQTQSELLDSDNDMVRYNVAKDILDRTGHKAEEKKTVSVNVTYEEKLKTLIDDDSLVIQDVPYIIDDEGEEYKEEGEINGD